MSEVFSSKCMKLSHVDMIEERVKLFGLSPMMIPMSPEFVENFIDKLEKGETVSHPHGAGERWTLVKQVKVGPKPEGNLPYGVWVVRTEAEDNVGFNVLVMCHEPHYVEFPMLENADEALDAWTAYEYQFRDIHGLETGRYDGFSSGLIDVTWNSVFKHAPKFDRMQHILEVMYLYVCCPWHPYDIPHANKCAARNKIMCYRRYGNTEDGYKESIIGKNIVIEDDLRHHASLRVAVNELLDKYALEYGLRFMDWASPADPMHRIEKFLNYVETAFKNM